jgi:hypothetical protein
VELGETDILTKIQATLIYLFIIVMCPDYNTTRFALKITPHLSVHCMGCKNAVRHVARMTNFFMVAPNICGSAA